MENIYEPLEEYVNVFRQRFQDVAEATFRELADEACVDVAANRETCRRIYAEEAEVSSVSSSISTWRVLQVVLWIGVVAAGGYVLAAYDTLPPLHILLLLAGVAAALAFLFAKVHPTIAAHKEKKERLEDSIAEAKQRAWEQMQPLNQLYDWDILTRMMTKTVPRLEFDPFFTTQRLADLKRCYGWDNSFNEGRSVLCSHSGLINGNPFIICRTVEMQMGTKTYYGQKVIHWTTRERGADGKYHTVHHSQTLTASVTAPFPEYPVHTWLIYGNTAAPDLVFNRTKNGLAGKEGSLSYKWKRRKLKKLARNLEHSDYAMLTNEEFEVAFDTHDRNNNQQFALLFTPLAQQSMLSLLSDEEVGYGDDFDFHKNKMINTIVADHIQTMALDMNPAVYQGFDFDKAQKDFTRLNAEYFRAIYFCFAPLLCVPMYQQIRPVEDIYGHGMKKKSAFWEHEALANFWGQAHFQHPDCATTCILKTEETQTSADESTVTVSAHGYKTVARIAYPKVWGGDGRLHTVPVQWDEYLPVTGTGSFRMSEDVGEEADSLTQGERLSHIARQKAALSPVGSIYRRHIASKVNG